MNIIAAVVGLVWGCAAAYVNSRITAAFIKKNTMNSVSMINMLHMAVDIVTLAVVYLLKDLLPFNYMVVIVAAAISLSVGTILFSMRTIKKQDNEEK